MKKRNEIRPFTYDPSSPEAGRSVWYRDRIPIPNSIIFRKPPYVFSGKSRKSGREVGDCLKFESVRFSFIFVLPISSQILVTRTVKVESVRVSTVFVLTMT